MNFVVLKTGSTERGLGKQVPTVEPATGSDGSVLIYARCDVAVSAGYAYKIIRDEESHYVPSTAPSVTGKGRMHVGVAVQAGAIGEYIAFTIQGRLSKVTFPASIATTSSNKYLQVPATGATAFTPTNSAASKGVFAEVLDHRTSATQLDLVMHGREIYL